MISAPPTMATVSAPAFSTLHDIGGILVVDTMIDGKGPYHFVLDTGAGITVVTPELAKKLHLETSGSDTAHGTGNTSVPVGLTVLKSVAVGSASQQGVRAAIVPLPLDLTYQGAYGTIDGIVGFSFLHMYAVSLDIADDRAWFTPTAEFSPPPALNPIPVIFTSSGVPTVGAHIDGIAGRFEIDSGNNGDAILAESFARANGVGKEYLAGSRSEYAGVGGSTDVRRMRVDTISIGSFSLHRMPTSISQAKTSALQSDRLNGNFGYGLLRQFIVTLDYAGVRLYLQPSSAFGTSAATIGTGIIPQRNEDGTFRIVAILPGSPASRTGIRVGDTIIEIDGIDVRTMSGAAYQAALGKRPGMPVVYRLRIGETDRKIAIRTVDLLP